MKRLHFRNGKPIDSIGLGTWKSDPQDLKNAITTAVSMGYRHIDAASIYGNEAAIGEALQEVFSEGRIKRKDIFITSKLWNDSHKPQDVLPAVQKTLADLQLDYLDLYLMHWPVAFKPGVSMPENADDYLSLEEAPLTDTWKAMEALTDLGLVKHIGVSNFSVLKLKKLIKKARIVPEMNQVEMHPLLAQDDLLAYCKEHKILVTAYSPFGSGDRSEAMKAENEPNLFELEQVKAVAAKHGYTPAEVLLSYHVFRDCCVIPKSTNPVHLLTNYMSSLKSLYHEDMDLIATHNKGYRFINGKFFDCPEKGYTNVFDE